MSDFESAKQFFLQGLQAVEANNLRAAEEMFTRALAKIPDRVSILNNLSAVTIKLGKFTEAEDLARRAVALEANSPEAWSNLGLALTATDRHEEALDACDRALNCNSSHVMAWLAKIVCLRALKRDSDALVACEHALKLDSTNYDVLYNKSLILKDLSRPNEAQATYKQALDLRVAASPVFIGERRATQKAEALIVNRKPLANDSFMSFDVLSRFCANFPGQFGHHLQDDFHFNYVFSSYAILSYSRTKIPKPDFVINNHVDAELLLSEENFAALTEFVDSFGVPVVNHPAKAIRTGRDAATTLFGDIPGVIVPKTERFSLEGKTRQGVVREIEQQFDYPIIARTLSGHEGVGMSKIDSRDALTNVLSSGCPQKFFVTQFVDSRGTNEHFRKIRAAIVADEIILIRVDFSTDWNVHGRKHPKRWTFYRENPRYLEEEKQICDDPEATLGRSVVQALRAIRKQNPLDIFGIDFDVDADGRLVFYEANAAMNLFSNTPKDLPNPKEAGDRMKQAFQRFFMSLVAGGQQNHRTNRP
jgi:tetratricopeptide (TPR) repeat protein